jgi:hypothetical protein
MGFEVLQLINLIIFHACFASCGSSLHVVMLIRDIKTFLDRVKTLLTLRVTSSAVRDALPRPLPEQVGSLCIICRREMCVADSRMLPCRHSLHADCIIQWMRQHSNCPICHHDLRNITTAKKGLGRQVPEAAETAPAGPGNGDFAALCPRSGAAEPVPESPEDAARTEKLAAIQDEFEKLLGELHPLVSIVEKDLRSAHKERGQ